MTIEYKLNKRRRREGELADALKDAEICHRLYGWNYGTLWGDDGASIGEWKWTP